VGQADLSMGDGTLTPAPGLAAILTHGMDFFDRPSGVVIPQFASSLAASLGNQSADGTQDGQVPSANENAAAPGTTTSSRDYDQFSDPVPNWVPAAGAYDEFSDVVTGAAPPRGVDSSFHYVLASSKEQGDPRNITAEATAIPESIWDPLGEVAGSVLIGHLIGAGPMAEGEPLVDGIAATGEATLTTGRVSKPIPIIGSGLPPTAIAGIDTGASAESSPAVSTIQGASSTSESVPPVVQAPLAAAGTVSTEINARTAPTNSEPKTTATSGTSATAERRLSNGLAPAEHISANRAKGKAEEVFRKGEFEGAGFETLEQPMFESNGERFRLDFLVRKPGADPTTARRIEVKSSSTAPLTPAQKRGIANMKAFGAKLITPYPGLAAGTWFPPGEVEILRPGDYSIPHIISHIGWPPSYLHPHRESILEPNAND